MDAVLNGVCFEVQRLSLSFAHYCFFDKSIRPEKRWLTKEYIVAEKIWNKYLHEKYLKSATSDKRNDRLRPGSAASQGDDLAREVSLDNCRNLSFFKIFQILILIKWKSLKKLSREVRLDNCPNLFFSSSISILFSIEWKYINELSREVRLDNCQKSFNKPLQHLFGVILGNVCIHV